MPEKIAADRRFAPFLPLLIVFPLILTALYILAFGVNVPFNDQWYFIPLIDRLNAGHLTIADLLAQFNEHRLLFPVAIMLVLAEATDYNTVSEMYVSFGIAVLTLLLLARLYRNESSRLHWTWFIPVAWLSFSLSQYENWLWGWQIQIFLAVFCFVLSIYGLERSGKIDRYFLLAILAAVVASFSFFNGLLTWPVGAAFLLWGKKEFRGRMLTLWAAAAGITLVVFFHGWAPAAHHPTPFYFLTHPLESGGYLLAIFGSGVLPVPALAVPAGIILSVLAIAALHRAGKSGVRKENMVWISLILFSALSGLICMIGRSGMGIRQAVSSRYITFMAIGIIGLYILIMKLQDGNPGNRYYRYACALMMAIMIISITSGLAAGVYEGFKIHDERSAEASLLRGTHNASDVNETILQYTLADNCTVGHGVEILNRYNMSVYKCNSQLPVMWLAATG